jgi:threonine/homoserine/homoserine lactone efflux protein
MMTVESIIAMALAFAVLAASPGPGVLATVGIRPTSAYGTNL